MDRERLKGAGQTHDGNGNLSDDGTYTYHYDYENNLTEVKNSGSGTSVATYAYDPVGRRVEKSVAGAATTRYVLCRQGVVDEYDGADVWKARYIYEDGIDEPRAMDRADVADVDGDTNVGEILRFHYHQNALGSVSEMTQPTGAVVEWVTYDIYGKAAVRDQNGVLGTASYVGNPYLYTGREYDAESGTYYYRARQYSPTSGRFLQRDPLGYPDGLSAYEGMLSSPATYVDPAGTDGEQAGGVGAPVAGGRSGKGPVGGNGITWEEWEEFLRRLNPLPPTGWRPLPFGWSGPAGGHANDHGAPVPGDLVPGYFPLAPLGLGSYPTRMFRRNGDGTYDYAIFVTDGMAEAWREFARLLGLPDPVASPVKFIAAYVGLELLGHGIAKGIGWGLKKVFGWGARLLGRGAAKAAFKTGDSAYRAFKTPGGVVQVATDVISTGGSTLHMEVAIYPAVGLTLNAGRTAIRTMLRTLKDEARKAGYKALRVTADRLGGNNPGRRFDKTFPLSR